MLLSNGLLISLFVITILGLVFAVITILRNLYEFKEKIHSAFSEQQSHSSKNQIENLKLLQDSLATGLGTLQQQLAETLKYQSGELGRRVDQLTKTTEERLNMGFEKTTTTFADVVKRLALIDEAQKKITELSGNVVSLQEILSDKRSRGAFGEVQLSTLIHNVLPTTHFALQHTLSNGKRADCVMFLPPPHRQHRYRCKIPVRKLP